MPQLFNLISLGYRFGSICGCIVAGCLAPWTITLMEFPVLFIFCTDMLGNAPYAPLANEADVKTMIFKNLSRRFTSFVCGHEELLELFGESDPCLSNTVDVRVLAK